MLEPEVLTRQFPVSPQALWPRLIDALRTVPGVTLKVSDDALLNAEFVTGVTSTSWGENMSGWGERIHRRGVVRNLLRHLDPASA